MKLIESYPKNKVVSQFVDRYQYYHIDEPAYLKSVPNGKIEAWIIHCGECRIWDEQSGSFGESQENSFYPATNKPGFFLIPQNLTCLNIKMNLSVLSMDFFKNFVNNWNNLSIEALLGSQGYEKIQALSFFVNDTIQVEKLDKIMLTVFDNIDQNEMVAKIVNTLESMLQQPSSIWLASQLNVSTKTLERITQKHFGYSPKDLLSIFRFEHATSHIKKSHHQKLIDALGFGYYDQSHFIKECKRITGYAPKKFFSKLRLPTNDLIFE